jgi:hypothetical protein
MMFFGSLLALYSYLGVVVATTEKSASIFAANRECKAHPSASWPSAEQWNDLNKLVDNRLLQPAPAAAACHRNHTLYDAAKCASIKGIWDSSDFHSHHPTSSIWTNVNGYSCQLHELGRGCKTDGFPQYVLNATSSEQVAKALAWATKNNVRVNVKSTGHDFLGRYVARYTEAKRYL